jgi:hypothetical protein
MAYSWSTFFGSIDTIIAATWPECLPANGGGGVYEYDEVYRISQNTIVGDTGLPYAVYDMLQVQAADWGLNNVAFECRLEIHYIADYSVRLVGVRDKLELIKVALFAGNALSGTGATVLDVAELDFSGLHPANAVFQNRHSQFIAGMAAFAIVLGETA